MAIPGAARHLALATPDGPAIAPGETDDRVIEVGLPEGQVLAAIAVGRQPHDAVSARGAVFVSDELADTIHVLREPPSPLSPLRCSRAA